MTALRKTLREPADEVRLLELERLDALTYALWPEAMQRNLGAIDRLLRVMERRDTLLGLDAPTKVAPTTPDGTQAWQQVIVYIPDNGRDKAADAAAAEVMETAKTAETADEITAADDDAE